MDLPGGSRPNALAAPAGLIQPDVAMPHQRGMKQTRRAAGIACLALAAAVSGCGATVTSSRAPAVPSTSRARTNSAVPPSTPRAGTKLAVPSGARCAPAQLRLIRQGLVSEATEQATWLIGLRNTATAGCGLDGYPAIALLD